MLMDVLCSGQPAIIGSAGFAAAWGVWWRGALKYVVYPGAQRFALAERVEAVPLEALLASPR
jgi:hypothetical protein